MIFGYVTLDDGALITHRDSYRLESLSVVSVRRPLLAPAILFGLAGFTLAFVDSLYLYEMCMLAGLIAAGVKSAMWLGQLKLLSRDLRGSDLSDVIWGSYDELNRKRRKIMAATADASKKKDNI